MGNKNNIEKIEEKMSDDDEYLRPSCMMPYKYSNIKVSYGTEEYKCSEEENKKMEKIKATEVEYKIFEKSNIKEKIIIDTDLGTDWDDALAVIYALYLDNVDIIGITTNYGIPDIRAGIIKKIIDAYNVKHKNAKKEIPVISGASRRLGTHRGIFLFGNEGLPFYSEEEVKKQEDIKYMEKRTQDKACEFIIKKIHEFPNQIKIVSIGIPTNIGMALNKDKSIIPLIKEIVIMGCGSFINENNFSIEDVMKGNKIRLFPNHNISGDVLASKILFDSNIPTKIVCHSVTSEFWVEGELISYFTDKTFIDKDKNDFEDPAEVVGLLMIEWFRRRHQNGQCPHDPLTIHESIFNGEESPIKYIPGTLILHEWAGFSTFIPHTNGKHYMAVEVTDKNILLEKLKNTIIQK